MLLRTRARLWALLACTAVLAPAPRAHAQPVSPTRVAIEFELVDPRFRVRFGPETANVEAAVARLVSDQLGRRIGFVRFAPGAQEPYRLRFSLDFRERNVASTFVDRGIWVQLIHPEEDTTAYWFTLRDAAASAQPVGTAAELQREIDTALSGQDYRLIRELLARIPVALEALPLSKPTGWALPFGRESLCIRDETRLAVMNLEQVGPVQRERRYEAQVLGIFTDQPNPPNQHYHRGLVGETQQPITAGRVSKVFVIEHRHQPNCGQQLAAPPQGGG